MSDYQDRIPIYELHIRPLFRWLDRDHMVEKSDLDLLSYDVVVREKEGIRDHLRGFDDSGKSSSLMPTPKTGGPWPQELCRLFERWVETGCKRLKLGTGTYQLKQTSGFVRLTAKVTWPTREDKGWLDRNNENINPREYTLYWEDAPDAEPNPITETLRESFQTKESIDFIVVYDAKGRNEVHVSRPVA